MKFTPWFPRLLSSALPRGVQAGFLSAAQPGSGCGAGVWCRWAQGAGGWGPGSEPRPLPRAVLLPLLRAREQACLRRDCWVCAHCVPVSGADLGWEVVSSRRPWVCLPCGWVAIHLGQPPWPLGVSVYLSGWRVLLPSPLEVLWERNWVFRCYYTSLNLQDPEMQG